jgi:hypothetical protein
MNLLTKIFRMAFAAEAPATLKEDVLQDGTKLSTDGDSLDTVGANINVVTPEGDLLPAPDGDYELSNGNTISVATGSVASVTPAVATTDVAASAEEALAEAAPATEANDVDPVFITRYTATDGTVFDVVSVSVAKAPDGSPVPDGTYTTADCTLTIVGGKVVDTDYTEMSAEKNTLENLTSMVQALSEKVGTIEDSKIELKAQVVALTAQVKTLEDQPLAISVKAGAQIANKVEAERLDFKNMSVAERATLIATRK